MNELMIYILAGLTVLISMFLPFFWSYLISIPVLLILLFLMYNNRKKLNNDINAYLISGVGAAFAIIALFFDFLSQAAWTLAIFFILSSFLKGMKKEAVSIDETPTDIPAAQEIRTQRVQDQGIVNQDEILLTLSRKIDRSLSEINQRLRKIENNGRTNHLEVENALIDRLKTNIMNDMEKFWTANQEQVGRNFNRMNHVLETEIEMVKNSIGVLVNKMVETHKTQQDIETSIELIKQKSNELATIDMIREVITENIKENHESFEMRHIQNYQVKHYLYQALEEAKQEVCIISPWISKWVLTEPGIINRFEKLLERGVNLNILYGIEGTSSSMKHDDRNEMTEKSMKELKKKLSKSRHKGQLKFGKINSHYKLFICDEEFYVETSMNVLSNKGDYGHGFQWHEGGTYSEHKEMLLTLKNIYFGPNNQYNVV